MSSVAMLIDRRRLIWNLILLEFKTRYAGSKLGLAWLFIAPFILLAAYLLLFGGILGIRPHRGGATEMDYGLLIACGLMPWTGLSEGVLRGTSAVLSQRNLMKSQLFPMELLPVTSVCAALVGQVCGTGLLIIVSGLRGDLGLGLAFLPILLLFQAALTVGMAWILSSVSVLYRDLTQVIGMMMALLMFASPIAYTMDMVPPRLSWVITWNPLAYLIEAYRATLLSREWPDLWGLAWFVLLSTVLLQAGYHIFMRLRRMMPDFA
jgi:ABC-type polysaccharide/polyol phosphate export permease